MSHKVLCLTHSQDYYVTELVDASLAALGLKMVRMNTDQFPLNIQISAMQTNQGINGTIEIDGVRHYLSDFAAVWFRKNQHSNLNSVLTGETLSQATKESTAAKNAVLYALESIFWFDFPFDIQRAENKQLQLILAKKCGLSVPNSLLSNSPDAVRQFFESENGNLITKMLTPLTTFMSNPKAFVYTSKVNREHLSKLDSLKYCPMQFQQEIEKAYELRVVFVAGEFFTGKISLKTARSKQSLDWRSTEHPHFCWKPYQLPDTVCQQIRLLMARLSLNFGALDIIRATNGDYVFLEVNPCGEWGMLQKELDFPIAQSIARCIKNNVNIGLSHE